MQYAETVQAVQIHALLLPAGQQTATAAVLVYTAVALWVTANHLLALVLPATALSNALQEYAMLPANVQINIHQEQTSAAITTGLLPHAVQQTPSAHQAPTSRPRHAQAAPALLHAQQ